MLLGFLGAKFYLKFLVFVGFVSKKVESIEVVRLIVSESNIEWKMCVSDFECSLISALRRIPVTLRSRGWWYQVILIEGIPYPWSIFKYHKLSMNCQKFDSFLHYIVWYGRPCFLLIKSHHAHATIIRYSNFAFQMFTYPLEINVGAFIYMFYCLLIIWKRIAFVTIKFNNTL